MKNNKTFLKVFLAGAIVFGTFSSCTDEYLDINENPNDPPDVTITELLPSAQGAIGHVLGNNFQVFGGLWGQYWTQSPSSSQYKTIEQYFPAANDFDRPWKALYADALMDLKTIVIKATAESKPNHVACAKILQAFTYQLLTDNFGDVPFSEAIRADENILSPRYDSQQDIYNGIIALLEEADGLIDENSDVHPGAEDLLFHGDMFLWREFGNTLKLRVYLRMAYVNPGAAQAGITAMEAAGAEFLYPGEEAKINYLSDGGNNHPLYSEIVGLSFTQNLVASATAVDYMTTNNDPRVDVFYSPALNGAMVGIPQGDYTLPAGTPVAIPSPVTGGNGRDNDFADLTASASVRFMTGYESLFLQAEAVARGWMTGDAQALYEAAIEENFVSFGFDPAVDSSSINYIAQPAIAFPAGGTTEDKIKSIITQKWVSMCGSNGPEGWTEWRRTGYPDFFTESANSILGPGRFPQRYFYPTSEVTRNANFPGQKLVDDKVWWDVN
jgi:hypothetical protein